MSRKKLCALILGCPGSGKGTQTTRIVKAFPQIHHFQTGDFIRHLKITNPIFADIIKKGDLIPDDLILGKILMQIDHIKSQVIGY